MSHRPRPTEFHRDGSNLSRLPRATELRRDDPLENLIQATDRRRNNLSLSSPSQATWLRRDNSRVLPTTSTQLRRDPSSIGPTILRTERDQRMATRQTQFDTLPAEDRKKQEDWAQQQIQLTAACDGGYAWQRVKGGYRCHSGMCKITDELLAEGKGGYLQQGPNSSPRTHLGKIPIAVNAESGSKGPKGQGMDRPDLVDEVGIDWVGPKYKKESQSRIRSPNQSSRQQRPGTNLTGRDGRSPFNNSKSFPTRR